MRVPICPWPPIHAHAHLCPCTNPWPPIPPQTAAAVLPLQVRGRGPPQVRRRPPACVRAWAPHMPHAAPMARAGAAHSSCHVYTGHAHALTPPSLPHGAASTCLSCRPSTPTQWWRAGSEPSQTWRAQTQLHADGMPAACCQHMHANRMPPAHACHPCQLPRCPPRRLWVPAHVFNFAFVPNRQRILYANIISIAGRHRWWWWCCCCCCRGARHAGQQAAHGEASTLCRQHSTFLMCNSAPVSRMLQARTSCRARRPATTASRRRGGRAGARCVHAARPRLQRQAMQVHGPAWPGACCAASAAAAATPTVWARQACE